MTFNKTMANLNIKKDRRFKVTKEIVKDIRKLRSENKTLQFIADKYGVVTSTIRYWTEDGYRLKMREKNAKLKGNNKKRYQNNKEHYKYFTRENCLGYIEKYVNTAKYKQGLKRYKLFGQDVEFWEKVIKEENMFGKLKID